MQFIDLNDDRVYSLQDLHRDWAQFRQEDPETTRRISRRSLRNPDGDHQWQKRSEILGMTHREISSLTLRLRAQLLN